jgi:hypothetical protein
MDNETKYAWIATVQRTRYAPDCSPYTVTEWFDNEELCVKDMLSTSLDIPDCWGSYLYYIVTRTPVHTRSWLNQWFHQCYKGKREDVSFTISDTNDLYEYTFYRFNCHG